jgi:hypothetical protein
MSTVKISQLPTLVNLDANTANSLFMGVDKTTGVTGKFTAHTLAQGLFSNEVLNVGNKPVTLPNTVAQFSAAGESYIQTNLVNTNDGGTADIVVTANSGTDSTFFIDMGFANKNFQPGYEFNNLGTAIYPMDGYLYAQGQTGQSGGNLVIGSTTTGTSVSLIAGGYNSENVVAKITGDGFNLVNDHGITFSDGSSQTHSATFAESFANGAFARANSAASFANGAFVSANASYDSQNTTASFANGAFTRANSGYGQANSAASFANGAFVAANSGATFANAAFSKANSAVQNTASIVLRELILSGNLIANSTGQGIFTDTITSNTATFSNNVIVLGNLTANTLLGNVFFSNVVTGKSVSNYIQWFPQYNSPAQQDGQVWYSANTISLIQDTDVVGDRPAISKVLFERVYNGTGSTIPASSWVRLAGGVTSNSAPYIQLADATSAVNSTVEGFIKVAIPSGAYGFLYTRGIVSDFDASTFGNNGQQLFLSTTPGQASNVAPTGANSVVQVAKLLSNGSANGKVQVAIANQQAYGKTNGSILFANNNLIQASNTAIIDEANGTFYVPNGILYNSRSYPAAQTAITLNFKNDTWVRTNVAANMAVTLGNFVAGSDIVLFITNTSTGGGAAHTITHGCSAINSTVGATTFTLSGGTTARIKYYSFDGDLANTYASISYA